MKQSPRVWNKKFDQFLQAYDLEVSDADACVYVNKPHASRLLIAIWVDDGIICSEQRDTIKSVLDYMEGAFEITKGLAEIFVGLHITRDRDQRLIHLDQRRYLERVLQRFNHENCNPVVVPADPNSATELVITSPTATDVVTWPYRECIGCLQFASIGTRMDISYAVSNAAKFSSRPNATHVSAVKRILRYIRGTLDMHINTYGPVKPKDMHQLVAYCDADYAADIDDRKSRSGFLLMLNSGPVAWGSRKQTCTAGSTTESEYISASLASQEVIWMRRLLASIRFPQTGPTKLFSDNQAAIRLVQNPIFHQRTKHIATKFHKIREAQHDGEIALLYIATEDQLADVLTKPLPRDKFKRICFQAGLNAAPVT